jgi:hypothetical protein
MVQSRFGFEFDSCQRISFNNYISKNSQDHLGVFFTINSNHNKELILLSFQACSYPCLFIAIKGASAGRSFIAIKKYKSISQGFPFPSGLGYTAVFKTISIKF